MCLFLRTAINVNVDFRFLQNRKSVVSCQGYNKIKVFDDQGFIGSVSVYDFTSKFCVDDIISLLPRHWSSGNLWIDLDEITMGNT